VSSLTLLQDLSSLEDPRLVEWDWISENFWEDIVPAVQGHIFLSFVSVAIALAISLPTGILVARHRKAYPPVTPSYILSTHRVHNVPGGRRHEGAS
jgi:osmoprotectant transport system permease protein